MTGKSHTHDWQQAIIALCARRLGRDLTEAEQTYITSHVGFMALEAIEDSAKTLSSAALEEMLNANNSD